MILSSNERKLITDRIKADDHEPIISVFERVMGSCDGGGGISFHIVTNIPAIVRYEEIISVGASFNNNHQILHKEVIDHYTSGKCLTHRSMKVRLLDIHFCLRWLFNEGKRLRKYDVVKKVLLWACGDLSLVYYCSLYLGPDILFEVLRNDKDTSINITDFVNGSLESPYIWNVEDFLLIIIPLTISSITPQFMEMVIFDLFGIKGILSLTLSLCKDVNPFINGRGLSHHIINSDDRFFNEFDFMCFMEHPSLWNFNPQVLMSTCMSIPNPKRRNRFLGALMTCSRFSFLSFLSFSLTD